MPPLSSQGGTLLWWYSIWSSSSQSATLSLETWKSEKPGGTWLAGCHQNWTTCSQISCYMRLDIFITCVNLVLLLETGSILTLLIFEIRCPHHRWISIFVTHRYPVIYDFWPRIIGLYCWGTTFKNLQLQVSHIRFHAIYRPASHFHPESFHDQLSLGIPPMMSPPQGNRFCVSSFILSVTAFGLDPFPHLSGLLQ